MSLTHEEFACNCAFIVQSLYVYNGLIFVEKISIL